MSNKVKKRRPDFMDRHKAVTGGYYDLFKKIHLCMMGYCYAGKMSDDVAFDIKQDPSYESNGDNYGKLMKSMERKIRHGMVDSAVSDIVCNYMSLIIEHLTGKLSDPSIDRTVLESSLDRYVRVLVGINNDLVNAIGQLFMSKEVSDILSRYLNSIMGILVVKFLKQEDPAQTSLQL